MSKLLVALQVGILRLRWEQNLFISFEVAFHLAGTVCRVIMLQAVAYFFRIRVKLVAHCPFVNRGKQGSASVVPWAAYLGLLWHFFIIVFS